MKFISNLTEPDAPEPVLENVPDAVPAGTPTPPKQKKKRQQNIIDVDAEFNGDLEEAIAAAQKGDVVKLGANKVYNTSGITISKDITVQGKKGTIINGQGTSQPVISLTAGATGATINNLEVTNGNIGIYANGAKNLTLKNLKVNNIGIKETIRDGQNNIGISLFHADGFQLLDSEISNVGRKGVGINDTDGGTVSGLTLEDINLDAEHAQSFDAAGIKLFNTNDVVVSDNELSDINAFFIWPDITSGTVIDGNTITNAGEDFLAPDFNQNVDISGIYNEKSYESVVENNTVTAVGRHAAFNATVFTTETMILGENNFTSIELNTPDYWANEQAERLIAITEDPEEANFSLYEDDFFAEANIGDNL